MASTRKQLGAWYTPPDMVDTVVEAVITPDFVADRPHPLAVLDPSCGDGRFLVAADLRIMSLGARSGSEVTLTAEGPDAQAAVDALAELIDSSFGE